MNRRMVALFGMLALGMPGAMAQTAGDPDLPPDLQTASPVPASSLPSTSTDPRGTYVPTTSSSRFQRKAPAPAPAPQPTATAAPAPAPTATATATATTASPRPVASPAATNAPATSTPAPVANTPAAAPGPASSEPAGTSDVPTDAATPAPLPESSIPAPGPAVPSGPRPTDRLLYWLAAIGTALIAGLAAAKLLMPWPRPRLSCDYAIVPHDLPAGAFALEPPDIEVSAETELGPPTIEADLPIEQERSGDE